MAGILDKIKGMFAGAKDKATDASDGHDTPKGNVGDVNRGVADPADQSGAKVEGATFGDSADDGR